MAPAINAIDRVLQVLITVCVAIIVLSVAADVVARYGFHRSIMMVNELSRLMFIWTTFLVMPLAIGRGMHVAITGLEQKLPPGPRMLVYRAVLIVVAVFMAVLLVSAIVCIRQRTSEAMLSMPLSMSWFFVPVAIGAAHALLHLAAEFRRGVRTERVVDFDEGHS
ncbi:TRAP transporter small permease [Marinibacterium profundimaris]|uniref:TRAP transporter small permease protein n=1 Tax=Marinibacterium profundimaris TaxID=1679460 RepID=A0A225NIG5_9RHOB|nr:TRAP transporter small permease subunit [Marinibacterium profundimaris]OWU71495.1 hypothetical protein ATO3_18740 [Marinibacterium profundimaris]